MTATYRSSLPARRDRFRHLLRSEWTKFRSVRGWVVGLAIASMVTIVLGMLTVAGSHGSCEGGREVCAAPLGPDGRAVVDSFTFVHQPLDGDGTITARITSLAGPNGVVEPWAKAGLIVKDSTNQGSTYAAIMMTGSKGVRLQHDFIHDTAGKSGSVSADEPRWLRLTRTGDTVAGSESPDGITWTDVGAVQLDDLSSAAVAGLFVTSPDHEETTQGIGTLDSIGEPTQATATFDEVELQTQSQGVTSEWSAEEIRGRRGGLPESDDGFVQTGDTFTLTGSGDIAPAIARPGDNTIEQGLVGAFAGLIAVIVVGTMFITAEYRRGLIRTTFSASPGRARVLAAKAVVIGGITFVAGLVGSALAVTIVGQMRDAAGDVVMPVGWTTELRVVVGTAGLLAVASLFALAVGALLRRSAGAVAAVVVLLVVPYILAIASFLPPTTAQWLLRITPAAAFAIQQSTQQYSQVSGTYTPATGYYPLSPWLGFAVLCAWTAAAAAMAVVQIRRRDA
jgi:ABC-type transport system involved in multi-copper enzyme maturation permease subunit